MRPAVVTQPLAIEISLLCWYFRVNLLKTTALYTVILSSRLIFCSETSHYVNIEVNGDNSQNQRQDEKTSSKFFSSATGG